MIVLLTDFGNSEYVGVMKGVILKEKPDERIIDLCHAITPQNIIEASWILKKSFKFFPSCTFICVVDPSVGSNRKAIVIKTKKYMFISPDNGLTWETVKDLKVEWIKEIDIKPQSNTFHGRDVFAPAVNEKHHGKKLKSIKKLKISNCVVRVDHFGNVITSIKPKGKKKYKVKIFDHHFSLDFHKTYSLAKEKEMFLITGSSQTLEISVKNGNANQILGLKPGDKIEII